MSADMGVIERRSIPVPEAGCWIWMGTVGRKGYGIVPMGKKGQKAIAHRLSWSLTNGPIPDGMVICHKCDTPSCVNPDHLFMGTVQDNNEDRRRKGRYEGVWNGRAELTEREVLEVRDLESVMKQITISRHYGVSPRAISDICRRKTWTSV